ncbi:MAG: hypothetical protein ACAH12_08145 [Methylophilaceae bacterium]
MMTYDHRVAGVYTTLKEAESAQKQLTQSGFDAKQLYIFKHNGDDSKQVKDSNNALNDVVKDTAIGTAVGSGIGALGQVAITAANVSLFIASPLLGPLMMIGWGAMTGAFVGAGAAIATRKGHFADFVQDAVNDGHVVLVANTTSETETDKAEKIIGFSSAGKSEMYVAKI